jgi:hypothetical protein
MQTLVAAASAMHDRHPFPSVCKITTEVRNLSSTILAPAVTSKRLQGLIQDKDPFCLPGVPMRVGLAANILRSNPVIHGWPVGDSNPRPLPCQFLK